MQFAGHTEEPSVKCVNQLLANAISNAASDIHLEPLHDGLRVRFRIDGILYDQPPLDPSLKLSVIARFKVLAHIDITERRVPQDGQFSIAHQTRTVDLRVATFPALHGEKMVVRILDRMRVMLRFEQLGMEQDTIDAIRCVVHRSQGFFLVTGPTGSGKTTTLYAALQELHDPEKHIITLEDPVEYDIQGITQGCINTAVGFTFARGIRALLRQDPDVVMIGEIRDRETAHIAIEAALTGHMVLSTLHTNDAPSAVVRLIDMGVDPFLINAALTGVLAQRLARVVCPACKTTYTPREHEAMEAHIVGISCPTLYKGAGCGECSGRGYRGRTGIFELMIIDDQLRDQIIKRSSLDVLRDGAVRKGMKTLLQDGALKVCKGTITLQELLRVVV